MMRCKKCKKFSKTKYCSDRCNPNKRDDLSPFKKHIKSARLRARKKKMSFNITAEDLQYIWKKQKGICPYTGWSLINYGDKDRKGCREKYASLDRIDSRKGYVRGNVQFVCYIAQIAKGDFSEKVFMDFCKRLKEFL